MENRTREDVNEQSWASVDVESKRTEQQWRTRTDQTEYEEQGRQLMDDGASQECMRSEPENQVKKEGN